MNSSNKFLILGGEVIEDGIRDRRDIYIENGEVVRYEIPGVLSQSRHPGAHVIDAEGLVVSPGFVDIQVHLREPGFEDAEDFVSGSRAAVVGGVTAVQCMPNTNPCVDNVDTYLEVVNASKKALCSVFVSAAITKNRASEELSPLEDLYEAGARTFTDDGDCVKTARLMREAIERLSKFKGVTLAQHCEDHSLVHDGVIDEGKISEKLGLKGRHRVAEEIIVARDTALMKAFASPDLLYHVLHLSTAEALSVIEEARFRGVNVSAEVAPQHLALTSNELLGGSANFKMNPPLREVSDNKALVEGLVTGSINAIATDHAPHPKSKKDLGIEAAPPGMLGVETMFSVCYTYLVKSGIMTLEQMLPLITENPAAIIGIDHPKQGCHGSFMGNADITIFSEDETFISHSQNLHSKSVNSPWDGRELTGKVLYTFVNGEMLCEKGNPTK